MSYTPPTLSLTVAATAVLAVVATTSTGPGTASWSSPGAGQQHAKKVPTKFNFTSSGYGSKVKRSDVPASSDASAFQGLGCTNLAGITKRNRLETSELEGLGYAKNIRTRNWTRSRDGIVSSYGSNKIERVHLSEDDAGSLDLTRLTSLSRAYHDGSGFHTATKTTVGDVTYTSSDGESTDLDPPTASEPVEIPGVLKITVGDNKQRRSSTGASAAANALIVTFFPSKTTIKLAHSAAKLTTGVKRGYFNGFAAASETRSTDTLLRSGPQPLLKMPCLGTGGQVRTKSTSQAGDPALADTNEAHTRQWSTATDKVARGFEEASIDTTTVGGGQLVLSAIVGRVNVTRTKDGLSRDIEGTSIGSALVNGQPFALPELDGLTIPGVVRVDTNVVTQIRDGIDVVAVRLTFLDGTDRVTDLGHARLTIRNSRLK
jgi:hypothetical protein